MGDVSFTSTTYMEPGYESAAGLGAMFGAMMGVVMVAAFVALIASIVIVVAKWRVLAKMGRKPWAAIIPYYSDFEMTAGASGNPALAIAIPVVGILAAIFGWLSNDIESAAVTGIGGILSLAYFVLTCVMCHNVAQAFGKSAGWTVGLILLGIIFWPMLGFGQSQYIGFDGAIADDDYETDTSFMDDLND